MQKCPELHPEGHCVRPQLQPWRRDEGLTVEVVAAAGARSTATGERWARGPEHVADGTALGSQGLFEQHVDAKLQAAGEVRHQRARGIPGAAWRHQVEVPIGGIHARRQAMSTLLHVGFRLRHGAEIRKAPRARGQQDECVELLSDLPAGLVDDRDDENAQHLRERPQGGHAESCVGGREPRGRLVEEQNRGFRHDAPGDRHTPPLATRDAPHLRAPHVRVGDVEQAKGRQQAVDRV
mmetsp:Transcript_73426/g.191249  ORF Transcript_73426/g.191249 Transcript_73426/m.191249 type:complete len:237 (+) Transcript_73426:894-1604(+)